MRKVTKENRTIQPLELQRPECPKLKVAILYDELIAGRHALTEVRTASRGLPDAPLLDLRLWRFDFLLDEVLAELAISEIVAADVVLISLEQERSFTQLIAQRLQDALLQKRGQTGAVAVLSKVSSRSSVTGIRDTAQMAGLDFLSAEAEVTDEDIFAPNGPFDGIDSKAHHECAA